MTNKSHAPKESDSSLSELESLAENAGHYTRKILSQTSEGQDTLIAAIREEPVKATCIALGVGVLLGLLFRR